MGFVLVQFSDTHFSADEQGNPALERAEALCGAIRSVLRPDDRCAVVLSGDIADRGRADEYEAAEVFLQKICGEIYQHLGRPPYCAVVPGNHDLDYNVPGFDESIRDLIIDKYGQGNPPEESMRDYCLKPQKPFRDFVERIASKFQVDSPSELATTAVRSLDGWRLQFCLLNTTRYARRNELPSSGWFPVQCLEQALLGGETGVICIGVLHHPYSSFVPANGKELQRVLEANCDIILTGHDHHADTFGKTRRATEQNLYVEGGVLQDRTNDTNSTFNVIRIVEDRRDFECLTFEWSDSRYERRTDTYMHRYHRLRRPLLNTFQLNRPWEEMIETIGTDFLHPRCHELTLSHLFVYPDLQRLDVRRACSPTGTIRDRDVLGFVQEKKRVLIAGTERAGKTCLAKQLFKDLREAGFVPLLLDLGFKIRCRNGDGDDDRIRNAVSRVAEEIYLAAGSDRYWQTKTDQRALVVDDFDRITLGAIGRERFLKWADNNFGVVVLMARPGIRLTDILDRPANDTFLWTFEHVDIMECDRETCFALILKWLQAGMDSFDIATDSVYKQAVRYSQAIGAVIGKGVIPSLPQFVFMMIQQLEARGSIEQGTGLYGSLYEFIIRAVVNRSARDHSDLEVKLNYLSEFAHRMHTSQTRFLDKGAFAEWHSDYCRVYNCRLDAENMVIELEALGIIRTRSSRIGFGYGYYYCFFLAKFLANNIHEERVISEIAQLCQRLYNNDAAKTMVFLCHLSKDPRILQMILDRAAAHFRDSDEYDLANSPRVLPEGVIRPARLALPNGSPEEERMSELRRQDEVSRPRGLVEVPDDDEAEREEAATALVNEANSATHTIAICGQVIRNFYGSTKGATQVEVIQQCYSLCLRMMETLFARLEEAKEEMADLLAEILNHRYPGMRDEELDQRVRRSLLFIALSICYGLIKHISSSVGLAALEPTFDQIIAQDGIGISERLLDLSARLDYFEEFPEQAILKLGEDMGASTVAHEVLRVLVWEHFKLFERDYRVRQRVCARFGIDIPREGLPAPRERMLPEPPT